LQANAVKRHVLSPSFVLI